MTDRLTVRKFYYQITKKLPDGSSIREFLYQISP